MNYENQNNIPQFDDESIDLKRYASLLLSNWYWFAIALFLAFTIAYGINRYSEDIFTVSSTLLIKDDQISGGLSGMEAFMPGGDYFKIQQNLNNEMGILKSYKLNLRVIEELESFHVTYTSIGRRNIVETRRYNDTPFRIDYDSTARNPFNKEVHIKITGDTTLLVVAINDQQINADLSFGQRFKMEGFDFVVNLTDTVVYVYDSEKSNKYYIVFEQPERLANQYRSKLVVTPIEENASLVRLSLTGPVAEQEADYLNKLMDLYLELGLEFKNETADSAMNFIDDQIIIIADSLKEAENALENFRKKNKLLDLSREGGLIQTRIEKYETDRNTLILQMKYYEYLKEYLDSRKETGDIVSPTVMGITDIQLINLIQQLATIQQQKQRMLMNLNENIEPIRIQNKEIEDIKNAIRENIAGGIDRIESARSDVEYRISLVEEEIEKLPATEREMITIQRDFDVNNTVYTYLLEKRAEAGIAKASTVSDNRVIDYANPYNKSQVKPKYRKNYMLAIVFGLLVPAVIIILIDAMNNKVIDKKDIEKRTRVPIIGFISHSSFKTDLPVLDKPRSTLSEAFRSIRTKLKYFLDTPSNPVIAVSSTISSEGKTFISINLATTIAMFDKKVLLIGLDLRKPRIHRVLQCENDKGISTFLIGQDDYESTIQKTHIENLWYAPAGPIPPNPAELLDKKLMKEFLERAKKDFDYIIIDTPPLAVVTDALIISDYVDMYLLVVRQRYTSKNTIGLIEELYANHSIKKAGIIINDISLSGYYGYGLRYGYYYTYGYTYGYNYYGKYVSDTYGGRDGNARYYSEDS